MRSLIQLLKEEYNSFRLSEVDVMYKCKNNKYDDVIYIQCPESYNESDVQTYINDIWLNKLPSGIDYSEKFFGTNSESIFDVYFEYTSIEHTSEENHANAIEFDSHYTLKPLKEDEKLNIFVIRGLKYYIKFDRFDLLDTSEDKIKETLEKIFMATVSNDVNKYPIYITLDPSNISWHK